VPLPAVLLKLLLKLSLLLRPPLRLPPVPHLLPVVPRPEEVRLLLSLPKRPHPRLLLLLNKPLKLPPRLLWLNVLKYNI
jgi:hypothetical protein